MLGDGFLQQLSECGFRQDVIRDNTVSMNTQTIIMKLERWNSRRSSGLRERKEVGKVNEDLIECLQDVDLKMCIIAAEFVFYWNSLCNGRRKDSKSIYLQKSHHLELQISRRRLKKLTYARCVAKCFNWNTRNTTKAHQQQKPNIFFRIRPYEFLWMYVRTTLDEWNRVRSLDLVLDESCDI